MGQLVKPAYLNQPDRLAVAVCHSGQHVGLLYREENNPARVNLFHLCWHKILANSPPTGRDGCDGCVVPDIEPEQANSIIAHATTIWEKNRTGGLPYGFSSPEGFFDSDGNMIFGPGQVGLTCATIILAIFDLSGVPLLRYNTWIARPDDEEVQRRFAQRLRHDAKSPEDLDHVNRVEGQVGLIRFRPLEVAGGAFADFPPIAFNEAIQLAAQLEVLIR